MKTRAEIATLGMLLLLASAFAGAQEAPQRLPDAVRVELLRLEETYRVLDQTAGRVWPGWTDYKDHPFLLNFENGLRVLVGHPSPPEGFVPVPGLAVAGKAVHADFRRVEPLALAQPLSGGGGISSYGTFNGKPVQTVNMTLNRFKPDAEAGRDRSRTEDQILIYIHELFHCFQEERVRVPYPNFRYNPDADYAAYAEVEGAALEKAYEAADDAEAKRRLSDFLAARDLKRKGMEASDQRSESGDEVREGTAVYAEVRTLEAIKQGFEPGLTAAQDPYYSGFKDPDALLKRYRERMAKTKAETFNYLKCYDFGCFEALLLQRLYPGWQDAFKAGPALLDEEIRKRLPAFDGSKASEGFEGAYGLAAIRVRHRTAVEARDAAFRMISARQGLAYIISLKPVRQFLSGFEDETKKSWSVGLMHIFPDGVGPIAFDDVSFGGTSVPTEANQLYYVKIVDPDWKMRDESYAVTYEKKEGEDVFVNAELTTPLFTLKAPKIRIAGSEKRVRIWVLARVRSS